MMRANPFSAKRCSPRAGSSFLEVQVALILLGLSTAALSPVMVTQMRQAKTIESRLPVTVTHYVNRPRSAWFGKLGGCATMSTTPPLAYLAFDSALKRPSQIVDDRDKRYYEGGRWTTQSTAAAYDADVRTALAGATSSICLWEFVGVRPQYYVIQVTWPSYKHAAKDAPFNVYNAVEMIDSIAVDQTRAPKGESAESATWQTLGTYWIDTGSIWVTLDNGGNGTVIADAVRIVPAMLELTVVDIIPSPATREVSVRLNAAPKEL